MTSKPPKTVQIHDVKYKVKVKKRLAYDRYGECHFNKREIHLSESAGELESTFLHEVLHAVLYETNLDKLIKDEDEERLVLGLEEALIKVFHIKF